jgi:HlyD family secretion protein
MRLLRKPYRENAGIRRRIAPLGLLLLPLWSLSGIGGCGRGESGEVKPSAELATVERQDLDIRAESSGEIEPIRVVEVKSKVSGELQRLTVETGDVVRQGELIATIDPRDVRNNLAQAEADLELADARVKTTASQRRRAENLAQAGVLSAQDLEAAQLEETNARAQLLKARTNLQLAQEKTGDVTIRAPITGTVIEKTVEQGQIIASAAANVSGGTTLVKMADLANVQARALVDEVDIGRIHPGQSAQVTVEAYPGRVFRGAVTKIEPQAVVEQNVTMFPVLINLPNPEGLLKPGMNSEVSIAIAERHDVVAVPNGAVVSPREVAAAGSAVGLDEDELRTKMAQMRGGQGRGERRGPPGENGDRGARGDRRAADDPTGMDRPRGGWNPGGWHGQGPGGGGGWSGRGGSGDVGRRGGGGWGDREAGGTDVLAATRPGVVFVKGKAGPEPRFVQLGLSDWDYTEVVHGLEPGTTVYLISVARLQQQQQPSAQRMRERTAGGIFGGGGGGSRSGGGGGGPRGSGGGGQ